MNHTVLLVDDEPDVLRALARILRKEPYQIVTASTAEEVARLLQDQNIDLIVADEEMPGMSGTEFLAGVARDFPDTARIVLTGHPTLPTALRAINEGKVYQFFTKPCNEIDLAITIRRALEQKDLSVKSRELLEVTKRQATLIEQAKTLRRLRDTPCKSEATEVARSKPPMDRQELLAQIDEQVSKGRGLLGEVGPEQDLG